MLPYGGKPDILWLPPRHIGTARREVMNIRCFIISRTRGPIVMMIITEDGVIVIVWP